MTADRGSQRNPAPAAKEPAGIQVKSSLTTGPDASRPGRAAAERSKAARTARQDWKAIHFRPIRVPKRNRTAALSAGTRGASPRTAVISAFHDIGGVAPDRPLGSEEQDHDR